MFSRTVLTFAATVLVAGCGSIAGSGSTGAPSTSSAPTVDADVTAVSLSAPSTTAAEGIAACNVQKWSKALGGIGIIDHARLLPYYVPLTGREPEIQRDSPAFVVQFSGPIRLVTRGGPGSAAYVDIQGATCVVLDGAPVWYMSGPWTYPNGQTGTPEPAPLDTKDLPAPLP